MAYILSLTQDWWENMEVEALALNVAEMGSTHVLSIIS